jgi:inosine triphosphate pyrophosphatase
MQVITIVTGNPGKVRELEALAEGKLSFVMHNLDIDEIQSLDLHKIIEHKAKEAFARLNTPVIVDDVSAELSALGGLPGPFIKYFNQKLGNDALYKLSDENDRSVTIKCLAAYYDGRQLLVGLGEVTGRLVKPRGSNGFGFDACIVPDGQERTMAELDPAEKMEISHRGNAFRDLLRQLSEKIL